MHLRNFPYEKPASSWYQVAWADDVPPGTTRPLQYFGEELVLWRGHDGVLRLFDAFCPHLGAHMGYGGWVEGRDELVCPFHGWRWNGEGRNTSIPYSTRANRKQCVRSWPLCERGGMVFAWYSPGGTTPLWEPPEIPEYGDGAYMPIFPDGCVRFEGLSLFPQWIVENVVDVAHMQYVHRASSPSEVLAISIDGPCFKVTHQNVFGGDKSSTWLTPDGPQVATAIFEVWGVGQIIGRFPDTDGAAHVVNPTPVRQGVTDIFSTTFVKAAASSGDDLERAKKRVALQNKELARDIPIWEHMRYVINAPFAGEEVRSYNAFRRWSSQFYTEPLVVDDAGKEINLLHDTETGSVLGGAVR